MSPLHHFLIVYHAKRQELIEAKDLGEDSDAAVRTYAEYEEHYRDEFRDGLEIVLIGADSIETVRRTHPHYFEHRGETSEFWRLVVPS